MTKLKIPEAAYDVIIRAPHETEGLRRAAPLIVAAELRRLADEYENNGYIESVWLWLNERADQLSTTE